MIPVQVAQMFISCTSVCLQSMQGRGNEGALDADWWADEQDRQAGQGLVLLCSAEARPGDCWLMQNRNTGVEQSEGGERGSEWKLKRDWWQERKRGRERWCTREKGGREEGRRDIIEPVWVSRLTELQGAAPAQRCYCKFPSLYRIHPEVLLILSNIMSTTLELC